MPIYSRYLGRTLSDSVRDLMALPRTQLLDAMEELALMRDGAGQAVRLYSNARELAEANPADVSALTAAADAATLQNDALEQVIKAVDRVVAMDANAKDKISVHTLQHFTDQLVLIAAEVFGEDFAKVEQFRLLVRDKLKVPGADEQGTNKLPSGDVVAMDDSVPSVPT